MTPFWRYVWFWRLFHNRFIAFFWSPDWHAMRCWRVFSLNVGMFPVPFDSGCAYEWGFRLIVMFGSTERMRRDRPDLWWLKLYPVRVRLLVQRGPEPVVVPISYEAGWLPHEPRWWPWRLVRKPT